MNNASANSKLETFYKHFKNKSGTNYGKKLLDTSKETIKETGTDIWVETLSLPKTILYTLLLLCIPVFIYLTVYSVFHSTWEYLGLVMSELILMIFFFVLYKNYIVRYGTASDISNVYTNVITEKIDNVKKHYTTKQTQSKKRRKNYTKKSQKSLTKKHSQKKYRKRFAIYLMSSIIILSLMLLFLHGTLLHTSLSLYFMWHRQPSNEVFNNHLLFHEYIYIIHKYVGLQGNLLMYSQGDDVLVTNGKYSLTVPMEMFHTNLTNVIYNWLQDEYKIWLTQNNIVLFIPETNFVSINIPFNRQYKNVQIICKNNNVYAVDDKGHDITPLLLTKHTKIVYANLDNQCNKYAKSVSYFLSHIVGIVVLPQYDINMLIGNNSN